MTNIEIDKWKRDGARQILRVICNMPIRQLRKNQIFQLLYLIKDASVYDFERIMNEEEVIWETPQGKLIIKGENNATI